MSDGGVQLAILGLIITIFVCVLPLVKYLEWSKPGNSFPSWWPVKAKSVNAPVETPPAPATVERVVSSNITHPITINTREGSVTYQPVQTISRPVESREEKLHKAVMEQMKANKQASATEICEAIHGRTTGRLIVEISAIMKSERSKIPAVPTIPASTSARKIERVG